MKLEINGIGNTKELIKMLAWIEFCGSIGHTPKHLSTYIDGDGSTRFKFNFEDKDMSLYYNKTKENILKDWNKNGRDLDYVEL